MKKYWKNGQIIDNLYWKNGQIIDNLYWKNGQNVAFLYWKNGQHMKQRIIMVRNIFQINEKSDGCGGIEYAVKTALQNSAKLIPWSVVTISTDGRILDE